MYSMLHCITYYVFISSEFKVRSMKHQISGITVLKVVSALSTYFRKCELGIISTYLIVVCLYC
jgi:hypothetical protein